MAKFIQAQTDMMAAQTKAMAAQSLPPLVHFSGEGSLIGEESFDRWLEHFEERAAVAGWSMDQKKYRLKMHLDKTAFQTFCMLSKETKQSYSTVVEALRKRFQPVDIEELRGAEFYQIYQKNESVEEIGIKLQAAARKAFPSLIGKEHDRLMKGRFFQSLAPKWQRKLGAPKAEETFEDLFNRARTVEKRDEQYSQSAADKPDNRKKSSTNKPESHNKAESEKLSGSGVKEGVPQVPPRSVVCFNCEQPGHIARNCWKPRRRSEATGRQGGNPNPNKVLVTVAEMSDSQLEQELAGRRLAREQQILTESSSVSTVNVVEGAVGPTLMLDLSVEGLQVAAVVDTASNSSIISCSMLHEIKRHLQARGEPMPQLELPCVPLYGKEGTKGKPLDITAQVSLTFSCDGRRDTVPTFIQPENEQKCLIGMNVLPFLGITIRRANGKPLHAVVEHDVQVRLVQSTTIPSMKGRVVEAQLENSDSFRGSELLFQPEHKVLDDLGVWTQESLITIQPDGRAFIPLQNFQVTSIKLDEGVHLGVASLCDIPRQDEPVKVTEPKQGNGAPLRSTCASVKALINTPERYERLRSVLDFPDTLDAYQIENFKQLLMKSTDVFALNDSELGCTDVVSHIISTLVTNCL